MDNPPLTRAEQVKLMESAKQRKEDRLKRWAEDKEIQKMLRKKEVDE